MKKADSESNLIIPAGTIFTDTLLRIYRYNTLNKIYSETQNKDPLTLIESLIKYLDIKIDIPETDLKNIPASGPFIAVSNHPYRGIDSMILYKLISSRRPDIKILGSHQLYDIAPLRDAIIPVHTSHESIDYPISSFSGIRKVLSHLKEGKCVGIFPAAEDTKQFEAPGVIIDREWGKATVKLIKSAGVPILPVYFHGTLTRIKYIIRNMSPVESKPFLPHELTKGKNRIISVRIGSPISVKEVAAISDLNTFERYLRARVFSLGATIKNKKKLSKASRKRKSEPVTEPIDPAVLQTEYERIKNDFELFSTKNYSVLCAPAYVIPNIFREIGRLREITFREVGEGTGKSIDIDKYDFYYQHLFIWDNDEQRLVGAYRLGKGKDIMRLYGIKGFYISSLFKIKKPFSGVLSQSIELGRSFIVRDYQKKVMPLFLLWKGIMIFLLKHPDYRYLIGPVSISNDLSKYSKSLLVEFINKWFFDRKLARYIKPRKNFVPVSDNVNVRNVFIDISEKDINKIENIITDVETGYRMPVLLKKYLEINGKIIGFNIDPKFNNCLDGLMILDVFEAPIELISGLAKEMNDPLVFERFRVRTE
ncbi:MAG TPA: GNAT family N-acyltransferase [Bacteroidales bacterium]|nr:GNAT family N-acyltransferase [Bacteroidales bacterium]